jgi:hypothetical protein
MGLYVYARSGNIHPPTQCTGSIEHDLCGMEYLTIFLVRGDLTCAIQNSLYSQ